MIYRVTVLYYLKCPVFSKNIMSRSKEKKCGPCEGEKRQSIESALRKQREWNYWTKTLNQLF